MEKLNLVLADKLYYSAKTTPSKREFGSLDFLTILGMGAPAGPAFGEATAGLYKLAYAVKKVSKAARRDFAVPKLEGLWWVEDRRPALEVPRDEWLWKLLIRMPNFVDERTVDEARAAIDKPESIRRLEDVAFETLREGQCVQVLHVGPYAAEPKTIERLFDFAESEGLTVDGLHHEIYLSDPRKAAPEKMKTVIRYPVR